MTASAEDGRRMLREAAVIFERVGDRWQEFDARAALYASPLTDGIDRIVESLRLSELASALGDLEGSLLYRDAFDAAYDAAGPAELSLAAGRQPLIRQKRLASGVFRYTVLSGAADDAEVQGMFSAAAERRLLAAEHLASHAMTIGDASLGPDEAERLRFLNIDRPAAAVHAAEAYRAAAALLRRSGKDGEADDAVQQAVMMLSVYMRAPRGDAFDGMAGEALVASAFEAHGIGPTFFDLIDRMQDRLGPDPRPIGALRRIVERLSDGNSGEAVLRHQEAVLRRVLELERAWYPGEHEEHAQYQDALLLLTANLHEQGRAAEAKELLAEAMALPLGEGLLLLLDDVIALFEHEQADGPSRAAAALRENQAEAGPSEPPPVRGVASSHEPPAVSAGRGQGQAGRPPSVEAALSSEGGVSRLWIAGAVAFVLVVLAAVGFAGRGLLLGRR